MDITRHVIGCHLTPETKVRSALDDVASNIRQALPLVAVRAAQRSDRPARGAGQRIVT